MGRIASPTVGPLLREWRERRRLSQLDLGLAAGVSARHISFVETGRSQPSAAMILHLAERLDVPIRERNRLLLAGGFAPAYGERSLEELGAAREAVDRLLAAHEPFPALVVDRHWGMVAANAGVAVLTEGVAPDLLEPPVNVLRLALHPDGMARRIVNLAELRAHLLDRLGRQAVASGDPALAALQEEVAAYPGGGEDTGERNDIAVPLRLRTDGGELSFISTVTTFGTATEITVSELSIESFFPADAATAAALSASASGSRTRGPSGGTR